MIATAFFLFKDLTYEKERKYIVRLLKLYAVWSVLYLPGAAIDCYEKNGCLIGTIKLFRRLFITGTSGHLWYILAVIYSLLFLFPLLNRKMIRSAWIISIISYLYVVAANSYSWIFANEGLFGKAIESINTVLGNSYILRAPLFLMIGYGLSSFDFKKIPTSVCFLGWVLCSFLCNFEVEKLSFWGGDCSATLLKPMAAIALFAVAMKTKNYKSQYFSLLGKASSLTYFSHILVRDAIINAVLNPYALWLATIIICICLTGVLEVLKKRADAKWVLFLY